MTMHARKFDLKAEPDFHNEPIHTKPVQPSVGGEKVLPIPTGVGGVGMESTETNTGNILAPGVE
jgi:hypothetical protein